MPVYCYRDDKDFIHERVYKAGKAPKEIELIDGTLAKRAIDIEIQGIGVPSEAGWPLECVASGVHAKQAKQLQDHLASKGVPTEVSKSGNPIYRDSSHRKKALKVRGFFDKNSY